MAGNKFRKHSGAVEEILSVGLKPLRCVCKSTMFMLASHPQGDFVKAYCPSCGTFSESWVTVKQTKLLTNNDPEAAELGLSDEEMEEIRRVERESEEEQESSWGNQIYGPSSKNGRGDLN